MVVQASADAPVILQDRTLSAGVSEVAICPSMDLLAVVLDRVSVAVFRTTWQRLATIPVCTQPDEHITTLAWSPDGANLAVATSAADLAILSVDRSAFASIPKAKRAARDTAGPIATVSLPSPAACLCWAGAPAEPGSEDVGFDDRYEDRTAELLQATDEFGTLSAGLIFCGDRDGVFSIITQDLLFTIARLCVMPQGYSVDGLRLTSDLRYCLVFGRNLSDKMTSSPMEELRYTLRSVDLGHVLDYWPEIERVGREVVAITGFAKELEKAADRISECWVKGATDVTNSAIITPLTKLIRDFAETRSKDPWELLHDVFCGASVNGAVLQFLAAELSENGAKEALRAFRSHVDDLSDVLHSLLPAAENTVARASEYRALARLPSRFSPVGVFFDDTDKLFALAESLYFALGDFTWEVEKVSNQTEAFLAWLVLAAARAGGDSMQGRGSSAMSNIKGEDARLVSQFFQSVTSEGVTDVRVMKTEAVTEMYNGLLLPAFAKYRSFCRDLQIKPSVAISSSLPIDRGIFVSITTSRRASTIKFCTSRVGEGHLMDREMHVCIVTGKGDMISAQHEFAEGSWSVTRRGFLNEKLFIHDAAIFGTSKIAYLVSECPVGDVPEAVEGKRLCDLSVYECSPRDFADESIPVDRNQEDRTICLPEVAPLTGQRLGSVEAGHVGSGSAVSLSVDSGRQIASVVHAPRRVLLFQIS